MRVAAVVVNHNGADDLPACVRALRSQTHPLEQVLVVDNASSDGSEHVLDRLATEPGRVPLRVVHHRENRGYAGGANTGIEAVGPVDAVLVANPDAVPRPDFLELALEAFDDPAVGSVQGRLHRPTSSSGTAVIDTTGHVAYRTRLFQNRGEGEVDRGQWDRPGPVFGVSGALALYRRAMLDDVAIEVDDPGGGRRREVFDEDMFAFWEDVDLDWRANLRGWTCWYEPRALAIHERGGAGPRRTELVEHLNFRNRLLVLVKDDTWAALAPALPGLVLTTLLKGGELLLTHPAAALAVARSAGTFLRARRKRAAVHGTALVPSSRVVATWFQPFGYRGWIAAWWRRARGHPPDHEPRSTGG